MNTKLRISDTFSLPLDVVTRRLAILAMSGAGKSNVAVVLAEQMFDAGMPWVAIDPKGDWWGVRSSKSGKGPGLPIPIFGGVHGDLPLNPTAGRVIGELIVDQRLTCVLDVSEFDSRQDMWRFLIDLGETLLQKNREALHLFLEEADDYLPQKTTEKGNLPKCLSVWRRVVKQGRFRGIGSTQITQRNALLSKDTLYMAEAIIAMRATGKADRDAVKGWVEHANVSGELVASLPTLADGEAWISSPAWLKDTVRVKFDRRRTFDSGATPVHLERKAKAATLADVDLSALNERMAATIERAKADDPKALHARVRELERELAAERTKKPVVERVDVPVLDGKIVIDLRAIAEALAPVAARMQEAATSILAACARAGQPTKSLGSAAATPGNGRLLARGTSSAKAAARPTRAPVARGEGSPDVGRSGLRRMLVALAQRPQGLNNRQLGLRAGVSSKSGTFSTYLSRARAAGWIEDSGDIRVITPAGETALGSYEPLPEGAELAEYWLGQLGTSGAARMLRALVDAYPRGMSNAQLGEAANVSSASGTFSTYLSRLRGLELVTGRGELLASEELVG